jgi:hypothetical protein
MSVTQMMVPVKTFKRDYVRLNPRSDAPTVMAALDRWFEDYNEMHPHRALGMRSPRQFLRAHQPPPVRSNGGNCSLQAREARRAPLAAIEGVRPPQPRSFAVFASATSSQKLTVAGGLQG